MSDALRTAAEAAGLKDLDLLQLAKGETDQAKISSLRTRFPSAFSSGRHVRDMSAAEADAEFKRLVREIDGKFLAAPDRAMAAKMAEIGDVRNMSEKDYKAARRKVGL